MWIQSQNHLENFSDYCVTFCNIGKYGLGLIRFNDKNAHAEASRHKKNLEILRNFLTFCNLIVTSENVQKSFFKTPRKKYAVIFLTYFLGLRALWSQPLFRKLFFKLKLEK